MNSFDSVSDLFIKRARWERKNFKHFRQVILCCFPLLPVILVIAIVGWRGKSGLWKEMMEASRPTEILYLFMLITALIVFVVLTYYHWKQLEKCSRKIAEIDCQIAEKLSKSNF